MKYWKDRNKVYYNKSMQRQRIMAQYENEKEWAYSSNENQLRLYKRKHKINMQQCKIDTIKRWINNLKQFEKKIEKMP